MKHYLSIVILLLLCNSLSAQRYLKDGSFKLEQKPQENRSTQIIVSNTNYGVFSVLLIFTEGTNCDLPISTVCTITGKGVLYTVFPKSPNRGVGFGFNYRYAIGDATKAPEQTFTYRLPVSVPVQALFIDKIDNTPKHIWRFPLTKGDTIFAVRKGQVVEIVNQWSQSDAAKKQNSVVVQHQDGTMAYYNVLEKGSIMVAQGDIVYPDTPLALAGTMDGSNFELSFYLSYLKLADSGDKFEYIDIDPMFLTNEGVLQLSDKGQYQPKTTKELIEKEMSRREIKKMDKK